MDEDIGLMRSEYFASFILTGFAFSPDEVTARVGVTPTKTWVAGEAIPISPKLRYKTNGWRIDSLLARSAELDKHVESVFDQLQGGWSGIRELCCRFDAGIQCSITTYGGDRPVIYLEKRLIGMAGELNVALDVDIYDLP